MKQGRIKVYYGQGTGKTSAAIGYGLHEAGRGENVIIVEFLKKKIPADISFIKRLEPEIKVFRFQKSDMYYDELDDETKQEENMNMQNGMHYARKVLLTGECSTLILDEVLGLVDLGIITEDEIINLINQRGMDTDVILTGRVASDRIIELADDVSEIVHIK